MRHRKTNPRLGRTSTHRKAMFRNMVTSLLREERVETTVTKAKEARRIAERVITHAKNGTLHARRQAARVVNDNSVLQKLFDEIGPRFATRPGGYTRILKTGFRAGDNAPMSILELIPPEGKRASEEAPAAEKKTKSKKAGDKAEAKAEKKDEKRAAKKKPAGKSAKPASEKPAKKSAPKKPAAKKPVKKGAARGG